MKILAIDTSSQSASCAVTEEGKLLGEFFTNVKLTHSQTILPMVENLLEQTRVALPEIGLFAVTDGPAPSPGCASGFPPSRGWPTRSAKAAWASQPSRRSRGTFRGWTPQSAPCSTRAAPRSTPRSSGRAGISPSGWPDDEAVSLSALEERLKKFGERVFLVGDGAEMCYNMFKDRVANLTLPSPALRFPRASSAALAAGRAYLRGDVLLPASLAPAYLRLPQAERERLAKLTKEGSSI